MSTINVTDYSVVAWNTVSTGEWVVFGFCATSCLLIFVGGFLVLIQRNYPPLKAKQPVLIAVTGIAAIFMFVGQAQTVRIFPQQGPFLQCSLFGIWMNFVFGSFLCADLIIFRLIRLYWIFSNTKPVSSYFTIGAFILLYSPIVLIAIIATAMQLNGPTWLSSGILSCYSQNGLSIPVYIYASLLLCLIIFLSVSLRNVPKKFFSSYRENRNILIVLIATLLIAFPILSTNFHQTVSHSHYHPTQLAYPFAIKVGGRILLIIVSAIACNVVFWTLCVVPLYYSFVNPDFYNNLFMESLRDIENVHKEVRSISPTNSSVEKNQPTSTEQLTTIHSDQKA